MSKKIKESDNLEKKLKLKNISEGNEVIKATQFLIGLCKKNDLHRTAYVILRLQLKITSQEVEYVSRP